MRKPAKQRQTARGGLHKRFLSMSIAYAPGGLQDPMGKASPQSGKPDAHDVRSRLRCGDPRCECQRDGANVHCPAHEDKHPSLSINESNGKVLYKCHAGCSQELLTEAIRRSVGYTPPPPRATTKSEGQRKTAYQYHAADGTLLFEVVRSDLANGEKKFAQRHRNSGNEWVWGLNGITPVLYNLADVQAASTVIVCEGEKAVDKVNAELKSAGLYGDIAATTSPMGAGKWRDHYSPTLAGKHVLIYPDNDAPGRSHAQQVENSLTGKAASVKVVELPGIPEKGDAVEYLASVGSISDLLALADATVGTPQRFRLISIPELMTRPDPTWLVYGILQDATNSVIAAPHASFKTFLVLDISLHIACGLPWCGRDVRQGDVVYVCAEGASGMKARIKAWCADRGQEWPAAFHFVEDAVQIHNEDDLNAFIVALGSVKPSVIVFDTLSLCTLGLDENSNRDMNLAMADVKRLQDITGAHVMLVHHTSKAGGIRGASSIPAAVQSEFELKRERDTVTFTCLKQKDGPEFKPMTFTARAVEFDTWRRKSSLVLDYEQADAPSAGLTINERKTLSIMQECFGDGATTATPWKKACEESGITHGTFYRAQQALVSKDFVQQNGEPGKRGTTYQIKNVSQFQTEVGTELVPNQTDHTEEYQRYHHPLGVVPSGTDGAKTNVSEEEAVF